MGKLVIVSTATALAALSVATACSVASGARSVTAGAPTLTAPAKPFMAQVVGMQWLNPLQRRDYPTEWQLLWTMGLAQPNQNDDMVRSDPANFSTVMAVSSIASGNEGRETFVGYHRKYVRQLINSFHDKYFSDAQYFYNAHSLTDKSTWRELAGIHVEYAIPEGRLDPLAAGDYLTRYITDTFSIGNVNMPTAWSRSTPPDVRVKPGGPNAGFLSLDGALAYLRSYPDRSAWVMNWDAPSRPLDQQINENMVLLVLAGPHCKTDRAALAWLGQPARVKVVDFDGRAGLAPPLVQAWQEVFERATGYLHRQAADVGYVIHDAHNANPDSSARIGALAQSLTAGMPGFDFIRQTFNTPAVLGEMGAGTALTNVALGIAYAHHFGKLVLVAGTSDLEQPTAVVVMPPAQVRPIDPSKPWFRARSNANAHLVWWGMRDDATGYPQGYSR